MKPSPHIVPVTQLLARDRCSWAQGWTEVNSHSYWLREAQVQAYLNKQAAGILVQYAGQ